MASEAIIQRTTLPTVNLIFRRQADGYFFELTNFPDTVWEIFPNIVWSLCGDAAKLGQRRARANDKKQTP